jgi:hypothetical protein
LNDENSQLAHSLEASHAQGAELARARADLDATKAELTVCCMPPGPGFEMLRYAALTRPGV